MIENNVVEIIDQHKPHEWSMTEKLLLPVSLALAFLFDRMIVNQISLHLFMWRSNDGFFNVRTLPAVFWLCYLAVFYLFFWKRLKHNYVLWIVAACVAALSVWNFVFPQFGSNWQFRTLTALVIPAVLMAHAQWLSRSYTLKNFDLLGIVAAWFDGWIIKPFTGLGALFGTSASLVSEENKHVAKRIVLGLVIALGMMVVIFPLLMSADQVFSYYVSGFFSGFGSSRTLFHFFVVILAFGWFYSSLWNVGFGMVPKPVSRNTDTFDTIISATVLGCVILVYVLFCLVQFTYLFARAGLPDGMTFAEYAREGFAQTVVVCAINLLIFGVFLWRGNRGKLITALLCGLLALTGIMLVSGAIRLNLYIDVFGMTWLRLLSAWFIVYLAAVVVLCGVRIKKEIPLLGICTLLLLVWYVVLGYLNPDGFIHWFNRPF